MTENYVLQKLNDHEFSPDFMLNQHQTVQNYDWKTANYWKTTHQPEHTINT